MYYSTFPRNIVDRIFLSNVSEGQDYIHISSLELLDEEIGRKKKIFKSAENKYLLR